jgi:1-deoxy-D-xylulose-5-phosphate reductoisomerase
MNKILELVEAQKLFKIPEKKLDIIIHPNSLVHAIIELNNGLSEFIYHETSMIIPIANAIYEGNLRIEDFYQNKSFPNENKLIFLKVNQKIFPIIKLKKLINKYSSSSIIVNASNEILVEQFLRGKIPFLGISRIIMSVLKDRNYKKNAIKRAKNLGQIIKLDNWAKEITFSKIKKFYA